MECKLVKNVMELQRGCSLCCGPFVLQKHQTEFIIDFTTLVLLVLVGAMMMNGLLKSTEIVCETSGLLVSE